MSTDVRPGNPAPLGLFGFGSTTILLNIHNAGFTPLSGAILGLGIFVGGLAQIIAGVQEWKTGNTFGATAFTAYGFFWLSLVAIWTLPKLNLAAPGDPLTMGFFLTLWGGFTFGMWIGTLRLNRMLQVVFGSLTLLFALLACRDFLSLSVPQAAVWVGLAAGWTGLFCGLSAVYGALALVLNEVYGRVVLPLGVVKS